MKKLYFILLIPIFFSCNKDRGTDNEGNEPININNDIKFVSQIIYKDSLMNERNKWSFNYDQYNRIKNGNRTDNQGVVFQEFTVSYLINDVSNIMISTNSNEYSYDVAYTDAIISINNIHSTGSSNQKIHLIDDNFIDEIYYDTEFSKFFERTDNDDLRVTSDGNLNLPRIFSNYEVGNDIRPDPISFIIREELEINLLILIYDLKTSKNTPTTAFSPDNGVDLLENHTLSYDDEGFLTTLHYDIRGGDETSGISGTISYNYIEN